MARPRRRRGDHHINIQLAPGMLAYSAFMLPDEHGMNIVLADPPGDRQPSDRLESLMDAVMQTALIASSAMDPYGVARMFRTPVFRSNSAEDCLVEAAKFDEFGEVRIHPVPGPVADEMLDRCLLLAQDILVFEPSAEVVGEMAQMRLRAESAISLGIF